MGGEFRRASRCLLSLVLVADTRRRYPVLTAGLDDDEVLFLNGWLQPPPR